MKKILNIICVVLMIQTGLYAQQIIELGSRQSMGITGKGPGQDGAINPYTDDLSMGIIKNLGDNPFFVRIEENGKILAEVEVPVKEKKGFFLKPGFEMYFDSNKPTKAKVTFKKYKK
ncbi:hypothetical protein [Winogradskyella aurantiaca]|uniref:hypothetical protein n=1 Tax=Winogradskyella aurantiaca TaxID=2219558 RepID=UPI000E1D2F9D|nr:hypothetical protein [Winogradskyella aurantiaca]